MENNEEQKTTPKRNVFKNVIAFLKAHKRFTVTMVASIIVIAICITVITVLHSAQAKRIEQAQVGMCYITNYQLVDSHYTEIWYFQEAGYSKLFISYADATRQTVDFLTGSLKEIYGEYSVKISLFGQPSLNTVDIEVNDEMVITNYFGEVWTPISLEEALAIEAESNEQYALTTCEHIFGTAQVIEESTCSSNGKQKQICRICGYEKITKIEKKAHHYVNKICTVCGEKKPVEKSDIKPNTWYTYKDVLYCQNIELHYAYSVSQGKGMAVSYYFVCQHCHVVDETLRQNVPEYNYDINKMFTCAECGGLTTVKIKLE